VESLHDADVGLAKHVCSRVSKQFILDCKLWLRVSDLFSMQLVPDLCQLRTKQQLQLMRHVQFMWRL
jgi:hypothetical protein